MRKNVRALPLFFCAVFLLTALMLPARALTAGEAADYLSQLITARKNHTEAAGDLLASSSFVESSTDSDWLAFAMARFGRVNADGSVSFFLPARYDTFIENRVISVSAAYEANGGLLSRTKVTEWHRPMLALIAAGADVRHFGSYAGQSIDLLEDSVYNSKVSPSKQGINGMIFSLLTLNAKDFAVPAVSAWSEDRMIGYILARRLSDGGFALADGVSDPDVTSMVLSALAPYNGSMKKYTGTNVYSGAAFSLTVGEVIDGALSRLSALQLSDGGFASYGLPNAESAAQALIALTRLGISVNSDPRFIKNGHTVLDGLLQYRLPDGSFTHTFAAAQTGAGAYNTIATDQTAMALVAWYRAENGMRDLYDMREDPADSSPAQWRTLRQFTVYIRRLGTAAKKEVYKVS